MTRDPVRPIYSEDAASRLVSKKRKAASSLPQGAKRPARGASDKPDFSDADDEDDAHLQPAEVQEDNTAPVHTSPPIAPPPSSGSASSNNVSTDDIREPIASIERGEENIPVTEVTLIPVVPSSQDSSSQSGSDSRNPMAELERKARAALHNMESATGIHVS
jgi:hypothetical protein